MKIVYILFLNIVLSISSNAQTIFYVDATMGIDTNDGTSPETAWKTINKLNEQSFFAGDQILFKRNEKWSGTRLFIENVSGTIAHNIIYGAYGSGNEPILSSVVPQIHNWISITTNIWKATNPPAAHPERMLINGEERLRANIMSELDGVTYYWLYDNLGDLYIYSDANPNTFSFEYSTDFPIIIGEATYITIRDLDIQGGWTGIFINTQSKNIHLDNLSIGKYCREGIVISSDTTMISDYPENIIVENCTFDAFFEFDYSSADSYLESSDRGSSDGFRAEVLNTGELKNCRFKNWGHASISISGIPVSNVAVYNNFLSSPDICYGGRLNVDEAHQIEVYNNQIYNTSVQSQLNGQSNHYHHNIFYGTKDTPLIPEIVDAGVELQGYDSTDVIGNIFENNIFINIKGPGFRISGNNDNDIYNNSIRNNIFYNCGLVLNGESVIVEENLFSETYNNMFQNNLIFNSTTNQTCNFRGIVYNVANFNAQSGADGYLISNNIYNDPLFVDVNTNDYHLQMDSPCIDSGIDVLANFDFEANIIPFNDTDPDVGVYEFQENLNVEGLFDTNVVLYPNPSSKKVFVLKKYNNLAYSIISSLGTIVTKGIIKNNQIIISELIPNIYIVVIKNDKLNTKTIFKLIKN